MTTPVTPQTTDNTLAYTVVAMTAPHPMLAAANGTLSRPVLDAVRRHPVSIGLTICAAQHPMTSDATAVASVVNATTEKTHAGTASQLSVTHVKNQVTNPSTTAIRGVARKGVPLMTPPRVF